MAFPSSRRTFVGGPQPLSPYPQIGAPDPTKLRPSLHTIPTAHALRKLILTELGQPI